MRKAWGLTDKILHGEKTAESRWYKNKYQPWNRITAGDAIYFKDSGGPVRAKARVTRVLQFENLTPEKTKEILRKYGHKDLGLDEKIPKEIKDYFQDKKYCLLIFFDQVLKIRPFRINKAGFGTQSSWLIVDDIEKIKVS